MFSLKTPGLVSTSKAPNFSIIDLGVFFVTTNMAENGPEVSLKNLQ